jgi:tyrosinase
MTALYQAMNPTSYVEPSPEYAGSFTLVPGGTSTVSTPLAPFSTNPQGTLYDSGTAQSLSTFGYTYPEIQDWSFSPQTLQYIVTAKVKAMYSSSPSAKRDLTAAGAQFREWTAGISAKKFAFDGRRYVIRLFLESVPEDPQEWAIKDIGSFAVLPPPRRMEGTVPDIVAFNEISLMDGLKAKGHDGQDVNATVKYLEDNLLWRVQMVRLTSLLGNTLVLNR